MAPIAGDAVDAIQKTAWDAAIKWGFGTVALVAISTVLWISFDKQNTYIRETMAEDSKAQSRIIEQNSVQLKQNSEQLQRNSEAFQMAQETQKSTLDLINKALDTIESKQ